MSEWTPERMLNLLATNDEAVARALVALLGRQTYDEQASEATKNDNGIGFNAFDAKILTSFAKTAQKGLAIPKGKRRYPLLSEAQLAVARKRLPKYVKQLIAIAQSRQTADTY